jgi:hypothetical protein
MSLYFNIVFRILVDPRRLITGQSGLSISSGCLSLLKNVDRTKDRYVKGPRILKLSPGSVTENLRNGTDSRRHSKTPRFRSESASQARQRSTEREGEPRKVLDADEGP